MRSVLLKKSISAPAWFFVYVREEREGFISQMKNYLLRGVRGVGTNLGVIDFASTSTLLAMPGASFIQNNPTAHSIKYDSDELFWNDMELFKRITDNPNKTSIINSWLSRGLPYPNWRNTNPTLYEQLVVERRILLDNLNIFKVPINTKHQFLTLIKKWFETPDVIKFIQKVNPEWSLEEALDIVESTWQGDASGYQKENEWYLYARNLNIPKSTIIYKECSSPDQIEQMESVTSKERLDRALAFYDQLKDYYEIRFSPRVRDASWSYMNSESFTYEEIREAYDKKLKEEKSQSLLLTKGAV